MKSYKEAYKIIQAAKTAGETNIQAYTRAGICETTFYRWKQDRKGFAEMLEKAERTYNLQKANEAEASLYKRATGYEFTEVRTEYGVGANGQPVILKQVKTIKHIPPDVQAIKEVLHNLVPSRWGKTPLEDNLTGIRVEVVTAETQKKQP